MEYSKKSMSALLRLPGQADDPKPRFGLENIDGTQRSAALAVSVLPVCKHRDRPVRRVTLCLGDLLYREHAVLAFLIREALSAGPNLTFYLQLGCRCWLNSICQLLFNGRGLPAFWKAQALATKPAFCICPALDRQSQPLYYQFLELWDAMQQDTASTKKLWTTLGQRYPSMTEQEFGCWMQQDADEAFSLLLPMLVTGMELSGVAPQVKRFSA